MSQTFIHRVSRPLHADLRNGKIRRSATVASKLIGLSAELASALANKSEADKDICAVRKILSDGKNVSCVSLRGYLGSINFENARVSRSDLSGTTMASAILESEFSVVAFEGATFTEYMTDVRFRSCNFDGATFSEDVSFEDIIFDDCSFIGTKFQAPCYDGYSKFKREENVTYRSSKLLGQARRVSSNREGVSGYDFYFFKGYRGGPDFVKAGCRVFTIPEYRKHILTNKAYGNHKKKTLRTLEILRFFERLSKVEKQAVAKK